MVKKIKLLDLLLKLLFFKKVYAYSRNKANVFISLIIVNKGKLLLLEDSGLYKMASQKVDIEDKRKMLDSVKELLSNKVFKDISDIDKKVFIESCYRTPSRKKDGGVTKVKEELFFKIKINNDIKSENLLSNVKLLDLENLKIECFKNNFSLYDYRLFVKAVLND